MRMMVLINLRRIGANQRSPVIKKGICKCKCAKSVIITCPKNQLQLEVSLKFTIQTRSM